MDEEHYLWLASFHGGGIMRSDEPFDAMKQLRFSSVGTAEVKSKATVLCVLQEKGKGLWFGNADGTLTFYNEKSKQFKIYPLQFEGGKQLTSVWFLCLDKKKRFWVGTNNGLFLFNSQTGHYRKIDVKVGEEELSIRVISETEDGAIWLGTSNQGVCRIIEDADGNMKIETGYEQKAHINSLSVRSLLASSDGNLYIGYTNGFAILSPANNSIRNFYTTHDGLCSNFIGCLVEDGKGRIWLENNSGISRYSRHQHLFYNYYISGNNRSVLFCNNTLFFGNNRSLTYFHQSEADVDADNERVYITSLEVNNHWVKIGEEINNQMILDKSIIYANSIVLNHANRDFSLSFDNLSYSERQQKYNYRLLPYQKNWLVSNNGEKTSYTNLPEGEYTFEVKSIYPDGHSGAVNTFESRNSSALEPYFYISFYSVYSIRYGGTLFDTES
ncbi:MAG: hypothetical protein LUE99_04965 [Bacteroides sp.]|nr:hypothetical protein [Bacteroides sp.]